MTYTFKHALVRDAAYATLSRRKRQRLHSRIVDALESAFPFTSKPNPSCWRITLQRQGLPSEPSTICERLGGARSNAQLMPMQLGT